MKIKTLFVLFFSFTLTAAIAQDRKQDTVYEAALKFLDQLEGDWNFYSTEVIYSKENQTYEIISDSTSCEKMENGIGINITMNRTHKVNGQKTSQEAFARFLYSKNESRFHYSFWRKDGTAFRLTMKYNGKIWVMEPDNGNIKANHYFDKNGHFVIATKAYNEEGELTYQDITKAKRMN